MKVSTAFKRMSNELLTIVPGDNLQFHFESNKEISSSVHLINKTDNHVAFSVKLANQNKYIVRPNAGVVPPGSSFQVSVIMRAQEEPLANLQHKDNFLFHCVLTREATMRMVVAGFMKLLLYCFHLGLLVAHLLCFWLYCHLLRSHTEPHASSGSSIRASVSDNEHYSDIFEMLTATDISPPQYQVFINFRGAELRNNFFGFLVKAMRSEKINVFTDEVEFRGTNLNSLFNRIEESEVAVAIFSERYTESSWCLDELVKMNEQMEQGKLVVVPVFYKVDPTACANLYGTFGDNLRKLEWEYRSDQERIHKWKEALSSVFNIMGLKLDTGSDESRFVELIVEEVKKVLIKTFTEKEKTNNATIVTSETLKERSQELLFDPYGLSRTR